MRNIKIDEPVFRDKPLTDQDLKEREYLYFMGKNDYERKRGKKRKGLPAGYYEIKPDANKRPVLYSQSSKRFSLSGCLDAFKWLVVWLLKILIFLLLICVFVSLFSDGGFKDVLSVISDFFNKYHLFG